MLSHIVALFIYKYIVVYSISMNKTILGPYDAFQMIVFTGAPCQSSIFSTIFERAKCKLRLKLTSAASLQK